MGKVETGDAEAVLLLMLARAGQEQVGSMRLMRASDPPEPSDIQRSTSNGMVECWMADASRAAAQRHWNPLSHVAMQPKAGSACQVHSQQRLHARPRTLPEFLKPRLEPLHSQMHLLTLPPLPLRDYLLPSKRQSHLKCVELTAEVSVTHSNVFVVPRILRDTRPALSPPHL